MKSIRLIKIEAQRQARPAMVEAMLSAGVVSGGWLHLPPESLRKILDEHWPERLADLMPPWEKPLPSLPAMAVNAAKAVARSVKQVVTGKPLHASAEEQARRREICEACDYFRASDRRCSQCGCPFEGGGLMPGKWELAAEHCPLSGKRRKW